MNAPLLPEVLLGLKRDPQIHLELATEGVLRYLWESRWGPVLIEVKDGRAFVNGQTVEPFCERRTSA
jgi:hypothetical protein